MNNLFINVDNVNWQAHGVLACLRMYDGLEASYSKKEQKYLAAPEVNPWFNGRERGYVISMRTGDFREQINIAFFEHRNSDTICAVLFEGTFMNPPTINDIPKTHPFYESKWNYDHGVSVGEFMKMSEWIIDKMNEWWDIKHNKKPENSIYQKD